MTRAQSVVGDLARAERWLDDLWWFQHAPIGAIRTEAESWSGRDRMHFFHVLKLRKQHQLTAERYFRDRASQLGVSLLPGFLSTLDRCEEPE